MVQRMVDKTSFSVIVIAIASCFSKVLVPQASQDAMKHRLGIQGSGRSFTCTVLRWKCHSEGTSVEIALQIILQYIGTPRAASSPQLVLRKIIEEARDQVANAANHSFSAVIVPRTST